MHTEIRIHRTLTVLLAVALLATVSVALTGPDRADAVEGPVDVVYVTTGRNFPDALAGGTLAATTGAPMLTVEPDLPLPDTTVAALQSLDPDRIVIFGGPVAVSDAVKDALADFARSGAVTRIEGTDRHATAAAIADALPGKVHDADHLDGLDATAFLRRNGTAANADQLDGLDANDLGAVHGVRDTERYAFTSVPAEHTSVQQLTYTAPTDGFALVTASVYLHNNHASAKGTLHVFLTQDWDGATTTESALEHAIAYEATYLSPITATTVSSRTVTLTSAVPVVAGEHTLDLVLASTGGNVTYVTPTISVGFSPYGAAPPAGVTNF